MKALVSNTQSMMWFYGQNVITYAGHVNLQGYVEGALHSDKTTLH